MLKRTPIKPSRVRYGYTQDKRSTTPVIAVIVLIAIWYLLIGKDLLAQFGSQNNGMQVKEKVYYDFPCSEANLARIIGLTLGKEIEVEPIEDTLWYEKYYKQLETLGVASLKPENAFNVLSSDRLEEVFSELGASSIEIADKAQMQLYEVLGYYHQIVREKALEVDYESLTILATPTDDERLSAWQVATNTGNFNFEGIVVDPLKNKTVQVAYIGASLLGIMEIESDQCQLSDSKIIEVSGNQATIEQAGLTLSYQNKVLRPDDVGKIGCLIVEGEKIIDFTTNTTQKVDTIIGISDTQITFEKAGSLSYDIVSIEDQTGQNQYQSVDDLVYGLKVNYIETAGKVTRVQVIGESVLKEIRVLISNEAGKYVQKDVTLSVTQDYDMVYAGQATTFEAGTTWQAENFKWQEEADMVRFVPRDETSQLTLTNIEKGEGNPSYLGIIEVTKIEEGYQIVNEVDIEHYVAGVLPSEMPTSYGLEALKAQAVAIRTYGESCIESGRFMAYGAHVDDTTATQVYNRISPDDIAKNAVAQTRGLVLKVDGKLISNKFFATSCGYTANFGEVWAGSSFPSNTPSYLVSRQQYLGEQLVSSLQDEERFKNFIILSAKDLDAFDEDSPWFRWQVDLTGEQLDALVKPALNQLSSNYSNLISYTSNAGEKKGMPSGEELGNICSLEVMERGEGGNIMTLALTFEAGKVTVETEYLIRSLFSSNENQGLSVVRSNETTVNQMSLLPSAFFTIEQEQDENEHLSQITLIGGGNGHGVGLSQDGAKGMAERGYSYKEILEHYYKGCEIVQGE